MQQGHPRRKQIDRAKHEMKMYNRRRCEEFREALHNTFRAISKTVMQVAKIIKKAINIHQNNKPNATEYAIDEFRVDSGLNSTKQKNIQI